MRDFPILPRLLLLPVLWCMCALSGGAPAVADATTVAVVHTYYIAADEVDWDYAPTGIDQMSGKPFDKMSSVYVERGPHRIGRIYRKAIFREYTDATFTRLKPRAALWSHLGILGPVLRAEVGDTIKVVFKNHASRPYSMHPHGVLYHKNSEGVAYNDGSTARDKLGGAVPPGASFTYVWDVPERAGPGPRDPSSVIWLYHSHVEEQKDVDAGLVGAIIITGKGMSKADGTPKDVDREVVTLFNIFDENQSWYLDQNIRKYVVDRKGLQKGESIPVGMEGAFSLNGTGFGDANLKFTINGNIYGNTPMIVLKQGERVRWYLLAIGFGFNFHTPHWHGNVVMQDGKRTDVVALSPAQMMSVDMVPDNPGIWMFHCHVSDHMHGGMVMRYRVTP